MNACVVCMHSMHSMRLDPIQSEYLAGLAGAVSSQMSIENQATAAQPMDEEAATYAGEVATAEVQPGGS